LEIFYGQGISHHEGAKDTKVSEVFSYKTFLNFVIFVTSFEKLAGVAAIGL
jgi:hypothetical protein